MGVISSIKYRAKLMWLRRNEYESRELRQWFANDFGVEVGLYSYGCFDRWRTPPRTRIGRYSSFAKSVRIVDLDHPSSALTTHPFVYQEAGHNPQRKDWLEIGDDVWVGHNATILPGCSSIGRGAIIGAGALVTRDVPPYAIVVGAPGKVIRMRFEPELIAAIEESRWWEMSRAELADLKRRSPETIFEPTAARLQQLKVAA